MKNPHDIIKRPILTEKAYEAKRCLPEMVGGWPSSEGF